jgi:hypothetical protein
MTTTQAKQKFNEINTFYNQFSDLTNADFRSWAKKLNELKPFLCDTTEWNQLIDQIDLVKSKIS